MLHKMIHHPLRHCTKQYVVNINLCHDDIIIASFYEKGSIGSLYKVSLFDEVVKESFVPGLRCLFEPIEGLL